MSTVQAPCLYVVVPAYNEQDSLRDFVAAWYPVVEAVGPESRLVIFDDGSRDATYQILKELSEQREQLVAVHKTNSGHGGTVLYGYYYAVSHGADWVFQTDSDGQTDPNEFWPMWEQREQYDFQCGWRADREDGISRKIVTRVLRLVVLLKFGTWVTDANTPFRLMDAASLREKIRKIPEGYTLSNVLLSVLYLRDTAMRTRFVRITFKQRQAGVNSINLRKIVLLGRNALADFSRLRKAIDAR